MKCPLCAAPVNEGQRFCAKCSDLRRRDPQAFAQRVSSHLGGGQTAGPSAGGLLADYRPQFLLGLVGIVLLAGWLLYEQGIFGFGTLPPFKKQSSSSFDPCRGKERCVVAFFAPWCPACRATLPLMYALADRAARTGKVGIQIVIGRDEIDNLHSMASKISGSVYLDEDQSFADAAGVSGVPAWWVIDQRRKILARGTGLVAATKADDPAVTYFVNNKLKLGNFMP